MTIQRRSQKAANTRHIALKTLENLEMRPRPLAEALAAQKGFLELSARDQGFIRTLVLHVLRQSGRLDCKIDPLVKHWPGGESGRRLRWLLRLGLVELYFLSTPSYAVVKEYTGLTRACRLGGFSGLVNAVLRKLAKDDSSSLSASFLSHWPGWLQKEWVDALGQERAENLASYLAQPPHLDLSFKSVSTREQMEAALDIPHVSFAPRHLRLSADQRVSVQDLPFYDQGGWWVQDIAASLPATLFTAPLTGQEILDLCAAPGGKTLQLSAAGAKVWAIDNNPARLSRLQENLARCQLSAEPILADVLTFSPDRLNGKLADGILLDAPCSATGTLRRHPEIGLRLRRDGTSYTKKTCDLQRHLLSAAARLVRPGGQLIYSVCSLGHAEGEGQDRWVRQNLSDLLKPDPITPEQLPPLFQNSLSTEGTVKIWPDCTPVNVPEDLAGCDGFFIARYRRL